jgi:hypothetical protein
MEAAVARDRAVGTGSIGWDGGGGGAREGRRRGVERAGGQRGVGRAGGKHKVGRVVWGRSVGRGARGREVEGAPGSVGQLDCWV